MLEITFRLRRIVRQMWFLPALFSLLAIATVVVARLSAFLVPEEMPFEISQGAIEDILGIIASSMLAVATFSLATMVSAFAAAAQSATPRAVRLIVEDRVAQTSISAFIGAFLFSVVGIIALSSGFYSEAGRLILFVATLLVVMIVVAALIRWIDKISSIGRVGDTVDRVEIAASEAFRKVAEAPLFGCREQLRVPDQGRLVAADRIGHVQHFDPSRLQRIAAERKLTIHVTARPGAYVSPIRPLAIVEGALDEDGLDAIREAFVVGDERTFDDDPRFGLIVLNEIACRALSPAVNDPGTAIDVIETIVRILGQWIAGVPETPPIAEHPDVTVAPLSADDIVTDAFRPISRDGAAMIEVCLKLIGGLQTVQAVSPSFLGEPAERMTKAVVERARIAMAFPPDADAVAAAAAQTQATG